MKEVEEQWLVWRLIFANVAKLQELETHWSILDVIQANIALDYRQEIEEQSMPKLPTPKKGKK